MQQGCVLLVVRVSEPGQPEQQRSEGSMAKPCPEDGYQWDLGNAISSGLCAPLKALLLCLPVSFPSHISIKRENPWRQPLHPSDICFT